MADLQKTERYVSDLLTVAGIGRDGEEPDVWQALHHLLVAVAVYEQLSGEGRELVQGVIKNRLQYFFGTKISLKERKQRKAKKSFPPYPLSKDKERESKEDKTLPTVGDAGAVARHSRLLATLPERREAFRKECLEYRGQMTDEQLKAFFYYYSEENQKTGKMLFESKKTWNIRNRIEGWRLRSYTYDDDAAALRMTKLKKRQGKEAAAAEQQARVAAEREQADRQREQQSDESREQSMTTDEYIAANPDGLMARIYRKNKEKIKNDAENFGTTD